MTGEDPKRTNDTHLNMTYSLISFRQPNSKTRWLITFIPMHVNLNPNLQWYLRLPKSDRRKISVTVGEINFRRTIEQVWMGWERGYELLMRVEWDLTGRCRSCAAMSDSNKKTEQTSSQRGFVANGKKKPQSASSPATLWRISAPSSHLLPIHSTHNYLF